MEDSVTTKDLASLKRMFEDSSNLTTTARNNSQRCRDYFDGHQWTRAEKQALNQRGQPDNVFNRVRPAIEGILGVIDQGQTDPRAWPRNPQDEDAAEVATKTLRYIEDRSRFDRTKMDCAEQFFIEGSCAVIMEMDGEDIHPTQIRWEEFFYDPRSRRKDFKDARYLGVAKWKYADEVAASYPEAKTSIEGEITGAGMGDQTFEDRPTDGGANVAWVDAKKRRVMVVEMYYREGGVWYRCVFHSGGVLAEGKSQYLDSKKQSKCPIEAASCYVDRENNRYGKVLDMIGPQDEINKRRSKLLHLINVSQIQAVDPSAVEVDSEQARKEAAKPDGVIPFGWQKVPTSDMATGQSLLLQEAKGEIERMGPNPAILGRQGEGQSGRANLVRQQAGLTELAPTLGTFDDLLLRIYRQMWECARQFWTGPMWIRVTDDEGAVEFVGLNQFDTVLDPFTGQQVKQPKIDPKTGEPMPPNSLGEMDMDITIETTPDTASVQQEQFLALVDLAKSGIPIPPQILIKASTLPKKREIMDEMKAIAEQPDPKAKIEEAGAVADIENTQADTQLKLVKAQAEEINTTLSAYQAGASSAEPARPAAGG